MVLLVKKKKKQKNLPDNAGRYKRHRFYPWVGKIPWRRKQQPTLVVLPEESHGQRSLAGYCPWVSRSQTQLKRLSISIVIFKVLYCKVKHVLLLFCVFFFFLIYFIFKLYIIVLVLCLFLCIICMKKNINLLQYSTIKPIVLDGCLG